MSRVWNSIEILRNASHVLMWASALLAVAAALAAGVRYYVDRRVGELSAQTAELKSKHRHLTTEQRAKLIGLLKQAPAGKALLTCPINDSEACDFVGEIGNALSEAGWTADRDIPRFFSVTPIGIELSVRRNDVANPPAEALDGALETIGFKIAKRTLYP